MRATGALALKYCHLLPELKIRASTARRRHLQESNRPPFVIAEHALGARADPILAAGVSGRISFFHPVNIQR
jgi:hypothetical protein